MRRGVDEVVDSTALVEAIEAIPRRERSEIARRVFDRLSAAEQWAVIERVFDDEDVRNALQAHRDAIALDAQRVATRDGVVANARVAGRLDTTCVKPGERVAIGLFREGDVHAAISRGSASSTVARRLVLRAVDNHGTFQVVEDVYNPAGGYFVTAAYDESTWRTSDRLDAHARVRVGSFTGIGDDWSFEPAIVPGGRFDVDVAGEVRTGPLHVGYVVLGDVDLFAARGR
jgi:hypothetical protein